MSEVPGWPRLLIAPLAALLSVGALAWLYLPRAPRLDDARMRQAAESLSAQLPAAREAQTAALWPDSQRSVAELAALQVGAAGMSLARVGWEEASADWAVSAVDLVVQARGPADNVPILVDGLLQQARPTLVRHLWVRDEGEAVLVEVKLRFFRPGSPQLTGEAPAEQALLAAQSLSQVEAFAALVPTLQSRAAQNGAMVRIALPGVLRAVPTSPRGYLGLDFAGVRPEVLTDPEGI